MYFTAVSWENLKEQSWTLLSNSGENDTRERNIGNLCKCCSSRNTVSLILQPQNSYSSRVTSISRRKKGKQSPSLRSLAMPVLHNTAHAQGAAHGPADLHTFLHGSKIFRALLALLPCGSQSLDGNKTSLLSLAPTNCTETPSQTCTSQYPNSVSPALFLVRQSLVEHLGTH